MTSVMSPSQEKLCEAIAKAIREHYGKKRVNISDCLGALAYIAAEFFAAVPDFHSRREHRTFFGLELEINLTRRLMEGDVAKDVVEMETNTKH